MKTLKIIITLAIGLATGIILMAIIIASKPKTERDAYLEKLEEIDQMEQAGEPIQRVQ